MDDFIIKDELYTFREVADIMRISTETVSNMVRSGRIPAVPVGEGQQRITRRILKKDLEKYFEENTKVG